MEQENICITGKDWQAEFTPQSETAMSFDFSGCKFNLMPLKFGNISEAYGIAKKFQHHETIDGMRQSVNLSTVIPLGAEPLLRRDVAFFANHATVSSYLELRGNLKIDQMNIDPLFMPGKWQRIGIINIPACGKAIAAPQWYELDGSEQVIYNSQKPFLVCLLENSDGQIIEIGTGNDLWRWQSANRVDGAEAEFTVSVANDGVTIDRKVFSFSEAVEMENRPWRFKWYFAWGNRKDEAVEFPDNARLFANNAKFSAEPDKPSIFDFTAINVPDATAVINENNETVSEFCFEAGMFIKQLRKFIRSATQHCSDETITFIGLEPHTCASSSHLERSRKENLIHWDIMSLFDFYDWANRQLVKNDLRLRIMPCSESPIRILPSISGMMHFRDK
jgi:hypothetical protein